MKSISSHTSEQAQESLNYWVNDISNRLTLPEHKLLVMVLYRAVLDYLYCHTRSIEHRTASAWLFPNKSLKNEPFSLCWCADHLSPDPEGFVKAIRSYVKQIPLRRFRMRTPSALPEDLILLIKGFQSDNRH